MTDDSSASDQGSAAGLKVGAMAEPHPPNAGDRSERVSRLYVSELTAVDLERAPAILGGPSAAWLGERVADSAPDVRCFLGDLELHPQGMGPLLFRKSAVVGLGLLRPTVDGWLVPIEWRAATLAPLFPVFAGTLRIRADRLELDGYYGPPGGALGQLADEAFLRRAAVWTARWLLRRISAALTDIRHPPGFDASANH